MHSRRNCPHALLAVALLAAATATAAEPVTRDDGRQIDPETGLVLVRDQGRGSGWRVLGDLGGWLYDMFLLNPYMYGRDSWDRVFPPPRELDADTRERLADDLGVPREGVYPYRHRR